MKLHTVCVAFLAFVGFTGAKEVCYDKIGCFSDDPPFDDRPLPQSPEDINVRFKLYTRQNPDKPDIMTPDSISIRFKPNRPTKIIVHGFLSSTASVWVPEMRKSLLKQGDYNVVATDWYYGALQLWYPTAASNTRVVGALIALLLQNMNKVRGLRYRDVHCIGHSLGAHTCGYAGKRISKLGRITGMDPAGPLFWARPAIARLDKANAVFNDNLHTDGNYKVIPKYGLGEPIGHVDFYPNGGARQPGCLTFGKRNKNKNKIDSIPQGLDKIAACSHSMSYEYFTESITSRCQFTSNPCKTLDNAYWGNCEECYGITCQRMGFHSNKRPGRGIFWLQTNVFYPYCYS